MTTTCPAAQEPAAFEILDDDELAAVVGGSGLYETLQNASSVAFGKVPGGCGCGFAH